MATHFSILAWKISWTEEITAYMGSQRVRHDWACTNAVTNIHYIYTHMRAHTHTHIFLCSCERISPGEYVVGDFYFQLYQLLSKMVASIFTPAIKKFLFSHIHLIFDIRLFKKHFYNLMGLWGCDLGKGSFGRVAGTEKTECLGWERVGDSEIRLVGVNYAFSSFSCRRNEEVLELVEHLCYNWGVLSCLE